MNKDIKELSKLLEDTLSSIKQEEQDRNISTLINEVLNGPNWKKSFDSVLEIKSNLDRELFIGEIDSDTGDSINSYIQFFNKQDEEDNIPVEERKPIKIYIDSPGGDLYATMTMIDAIKLSKTPVWTINIGCAYSGGFFTFIVGHKRISYPNASFLFHEGAAATQGDAGKFRNFADFYNRQLLKLKQIVLEHTKFDEVWYKEHINDDVWLMSEEALENGVCDEITDKLV